jgi:hypothetical protein
MEQLEIAQQTLRAFAYVIAATRPPEELQRLASSLEAAASWPQLHPESRKFLQVLAEDAAAFAQGHPPSSFP